MEFITLPPGVQLLLNIATGVGVPLLLSFAGRVRAVEKEFGDFKESVAREYVRHEALDKIEETLSRMEQATREGFWRIEDKMSSKADK